ncbi:DNA polymerase III subunit delta [uncultured Thiodictyon sp.]|uniref:DNA polymerase III subunit delta n=1 Tax=uncultured Thiodictyon sp. TaxID=1846217 RepID=UPI0026006939|nr:DNA polymerase III subunit delta [uncultured Thiodictyon sp.]
MRLRFTQLSDQLARGLAPVYLICGDEPYQLGEAARLIRARARAAGFDEREVLDQDGAFDWGALTAAARAMSLFCARKLIDLRIGTAKLGKDGGAAVRAYCERPCPDNLLLMTAPALERKELETQWAKAVEAQGVVVQVWPLKERELVQWLDQRLKFAGFTPGPGVADLLAERLEGNQMAAAQEIEKLKLLRAPGPLALDDLLGTLADSARFDLFALTDAALAGDRARVQRVLTVLRAEGTAATLVLWVLARDLRMLAQAAWAKGHPGAAPAFIARPRQEIVERALRRLSTTLLRSLVRQCALADRSIKGLGPNDAWERLTFIADTLASGALRLPPPPTPR